MKIHSLDDLESLHLDVLSEIGNIGSGNAATALATLLNTTVDIDIPKISLMNYSNVSERLGGKDALAIGMGVMLEGDLTGMMLQVMHSDFASKLVNTFYPKHIVNVEDIVEMDMSVLREACNITTAAYVNALASMTGLFINISPPEDNVDTIENILRIPTDRFSSLGQQVLFIDENLTVAGTEVRSSMILILEIESLTALFERLGIQF